MTLVLAMFLVQYLWKEALSIQIWRSEVSGSHQFKNSGGPSLLYNSNMSSQKVQNILGSVGVRAVRKYD
jgi:hypothetical protein